MLSFSDAKQLKHPSTFSEKEIHIVQSVQALIASPGTSAASMRALAKQVGISPSVLYHYFENQEQLYWQMFRYTSHSLGKKRAAELEATKPVSERFYDLVAFQFRHAEEVVAILKFYLLYRDAFAESHTGLPATASKHVQEILETGVESGRYIPDAERYTKIITHAINGYLLEHYPYDVSSEELDVLIGDMVWFFEEPLLIDTQDN